MAVHYNLALSLSLILLITHEHQYSASYETYNRVV